MEKKDEKLSAFRAGDRPRSKAHSNIRPEQVASIKSGSYPFLEKLLEADEAAIESFQTACQNTCRNLATAMDHAQDPETTAMCQAALSAYGHSLKLFSELLEVKYEQLRTQAERK